MNFRLNLIWYLSVFFLIACSSLPKRDSKLTRISPPPRWQTSIAENRIEHWLNRFSDPVLKICVHSALKNNYDLKAAAARVNVANELVNITGSGRWPQLSFVPGYLTNSGAASTRYDVFEAFFNLSWEVDLWNRIRSAQQSSQQEAEAVDADFRGAQLSLAARTAQNYFELIEANLQVKVAEQSVSDRHAISELVRGRFNLGLTRGLDLRLVLTDLANAEARLADTRNQVQIISRRLNVLLGRYPDDQLQRADHLPKLPDTLAAGLPSELLTRRPDLIAAFARVRSADASLASSQRALLPRLTLTTNGGTASSALTDIINPQAAAWNLTAGLLQPILTGDRLRSDIRMHKGLVEEALNYYHSTSLNAFREVEQALASEQWLRIQERALTEAVAQTQESRKLAVYSYRQGLIQILTLLDSYRSALDAQSAHLVMQRQLLNNRINLYLALGGNDNVID